jgi:hypothetical protein
MVEMIRHCPDCGQDMLFESHHTDPGRCPDSADGDCPEWLCTTCGAALFIGVGWAGCDQAEFAELRGRVA